MHDMSKVQKKYKLVIFDWDGTLMDSEMRIVASIQAAAAHCGLPVLSHHESKQIIGLSLDKAILGLYPSASGEQVEQMSAAYSQHFLEESLVEMVPFSGAESLLFSLRQQGVKLAVATGKSRRGLDQVLSQCGFGGYFDITRTPHESASKPDPLMLQQILMHLNIAVSDAVMVGDTSFDLQMAQSINMDAIALGHGVHELDVLAAFNPVVQCDDLHQLHAWLMARL
ncbi:HAD-IA family hydrolase [Thiomicrorhabdus aquaedulcis]|uniref:HAD-IA family hydrolase n=1 Tax=Thiomicrorhabdus aquaedulcis TaxID=2211106 RepID=UPI001E648AB7|nr:HAD-IA family hydrolase [Thiomicrorhabdus aquaedulcis]